MRSPNYTMRPQPFTVTKSPYEPQTGYPVYNTYPTPQFFPYNQTQSQYSSMSPISNVPYVSTSSELPYTYFLPDSQNPDFAETTDTSNFISAQSNADFADTTPASLINDTFKSDENSVNELETTSHQLPHIHAIDVQCSKDRMTINVEFNEVYNGIIYSKVRRVFGSLPKLSGFTQRFDNKAMGNVAECQSEVICNE